ncbi:MAG: DUF4445 domain-containing protein [Desulfobacterales bacterium]|nr:MAG: DUF4445 domain-containing protein [Desulfobacterales bacterium]
MSKKDTPWLRTVTLPPPSLQNNIADADRLVIALKAGLRTDDAIHIELELLKLLPDLLRECDFSIRCILFKERHQWSVIGIGKADDLRPVAGLAVDLGTSRVVLRLLNLIDGQTLAEADFDNPQLAVGPDILTRIHFAETSGGLAKLNHLIISGLNHAIEDVCRSSRIQSQDIYALALAGNTAMTHLFLGLNPRWIIREPYIPVVNKPQILRASELGLQVNSSARIFVFPNIGSYFGGDLIAGILYAGLHTAPDPAILVDVGTNAEVVVGNENWLIACAGAAGPALEGGVTKMGMMAEAGVIDKVTINPQTRTFDLHTIEDKPPRGICGSGVIDLAAQLFLAGMIDIRGKLKPEICAEQLKEIDGLNHLVVVPADQSATGSDLTVSQADLDSLIRSKAAMYTILETITMSVGIELSELSTFYVAGTFGSFIDPRSAITIGMLPDLPLQNYRSLGNSSLHGAALALTAAESLAEIDRIRDQITYLELNVNQEFMNRFSAAKFIPHTNMSLFPSVAISNHQQSQGYEEGP